MHAIVVGGCRSLNTIYTLSYKSLMMEFPELLSNTGLGISTCSCIYPLLLLLTKIPFIGTVYLVIYN